MPHLGAWEIALIVMAVVLVFGVGKLSQVGGALGKSIREFRKEKERRDDPPLIHPGEPEDRRNLNQPSSTVNEEAKK